MTQFKHVSSDQDLERIVRGVVGSSNETSKNSRKLLIVGLGALLLGGVVTYMVLSKSNASKKKKDSQ